jgi:hypothetical protein
MVKLLLVTMRSWVQVLETTSCRNAGKDCIHKTHSGQTLPRTMRKQNVWPDPSSDPAQAEATCTRLPFNCFWSR